MTAIETHFIAASNFRGSRVAAVALGTRQRIVLGWADDMSAECNHARACGALVERLSWRGSVGCSSFVLHEADRAFGQWVSGDGARGAVVWVFVARGVNRGV